MGEYFEQFPSLEGSRLTGGGAFRFLMVIQGKDKAIYKDEILTRESTAQDNGCNVYWSNLKNLNVDKNRKLTSLDLKL